MLRAPLCDVAFPALSSGVTAITAGVAHTCALVNGGAQCWGWNIYGQLGNNSTTDSHVPTWTNPLAP
jgi:alpha-tubulin suppressor-like RCC1 family protein